MYDSEVVGEFKQINEELKEKAKRAKDESNKKKLNELGIEVNNDPIKVPETQPSTKQEVAEIVSDNNNLKVPKKQYEITNADQKNIDKPEIANPSGKMLEKQ